MSKIVVNILLFFFIWSCNFLTPPEDNYNYNNKMKLLWEINYDFVGSSIVASPLILGDSLVIMSAGKEIFAVEQTSGDIRWKYFVSNETNIQTDEMATDGTRLYVTHVEDVRAVDITTGKEIWITPMPQERGAFWRNYPVVTNNKIFVSGYYTVYCLNA